MEKKLEKELLDEKINAFIEDAKEQSAKDLYTKYVIADEIWIFKKKYSDEWYKKYSEFKVFIANKLEVQFNDIAIAGSGKVGFSLNPDKNFKKFNEESDVDIIIISRSLFHSFWKEYLLDSYSARGIINIHKISFGIFRKYIFLDGFKKGNKYYEEWIKKTKGFEKDLQLIFGIENDIHYRIFESWEAAEGYYTKGIEDCINKLKQKENLNGIN